MRPEKVTNAAASAIDWEFVAISAIATGAWLRVREALTVRPDAQLPNPLQFYGEKSGRGWQTATLGPYPRAWAKFLAKFRQWQGLPATASLHGSRANLEASAVRLLQGSPYAALRFHAFGRLGAATLWHLGPPMPVYMAWGGLARAGNGTWVRASQAGLGASAKAPTTLAHHRRLQYAQGNTGHAGDVMVPVLGHVRAAGASHCSRSSSRCRANDQKAPYGILSLSCGALAAQ